MQVGLGKAKGKGQGGLVAITRELDHDTLLRLTTLAFERILANERNCKSRMSQSPPLDTCRTRVARGRGSRATSTHRAIHDAIEGCESGSAIGGRAG